LLTPYYDEKRRRTDARSPWLQAISAQIFIFVVIIFHHSSRPNSKGFLTITNFN